MLESIDWVSFGTGAGALAISTYAWSARGPLTRTVHRFRHWRQTRRLVWALNENQVMMLQIDNEDLRLRVRHLEKQVSNDAAWENYQRRKKGLPVGPGAASPAVVLGPVWCDCGHSSQSHVSEDPGICRACNCTAFEPVS